MLSEVIGDKMKIDDILEFSKYMGLELTSSQRSMLKEIIKKGINGRLVVYMPRRSELKRLQNIERLVRFNESTIN